MFWFWILSADWRYSTADRHSLNLAQLCMYHAIFGPYPNQTYWPTYQYSYRSVNITQLKHFCIWFQHVLKFKQWKKITANQAWRKNLKFNTNVANNQFQGRIPRKRYEFLLICITLRFIKITLKNSINILWKMRKKYILSASVGIAKSQFK